MPLSASRPFRPSHNHSELAAKCRVWALPFLTVLAPWERYHQERGQPHKKLTDWARQMLLQVRLWSPKRALVGVGDSSYAALALLHF